MQYLPSKIDLRPENIFVTAFVDFRRDPFLIRYCVLTRCGHVLISRHALTFWEPQSNIYYIGPVRSCCAPAVLLLQFLQFADLIFYQILTGQICAFGIIPAAIHTGIHCP